MAKTKDDYKLGCLFRDKIISHYIDDLETLAETFSKKNDEVDNSVYTVIKDMDEDVRKTIANISVSQFIESFLEHSMERLPKYVAEHCMFTAIDSDAEKDRLHEKYKHLKESTDAE